MLRLKRKTMQDQVWRVKAAQEIQVRKTKEEIGSCSVQRFGSAREVSANWERKKSFKMRLALHPVLRWRFTRGYGNWPC
jgi:hypothetical protein